MRTSTMLAAAAAATVALAANALAVSTVSLDFNGGAGGVGNTGFGSVYSEITGGYTLAGGTLTVRTLPGDTFGDFENDPDSADNMFYSNIDVFDSTTVQARVNVSGLNVNFHGGGIWMGTDQDHYVRMGVFHNSFIAGGPVAAELLRENEDLWTGATPPGPGGDIVSNAVAIGDTTARDVILRLVRNGSTVTGSYSLDNGATFLPAGTFGGLALPGNPGGNGSNTIESPVSFKVGVYAFGGPDGASPASFAFDSFFAQSVPEPGSLACALLAGATLLSRRRQ